MKKTVQRSIVLVAAAALLICALLSALIFDYTLTVSKEADLTTLAEALADAFEPDEDQNLQANTFAGVKHQIRVTIVAADGTVTGDSAADYTQMENHLNRQEIQSAKDGKSYVVTRTSSTIGQKLMYAVAMSDSGYYIRVGQEYGGYLYEFIVVVPAVILAVIIALAISALLSQRLTNQIIKPINELNDSLVGVQDGSTILQTEVYPYGELQDMAHKINQLAMDVSTQIGRLQSEKEKNDYILDNMNEGFVLLDSNGIILLINSSACETLQCTKQAMGHPFQALVGEEALRRKAAEVLEHRRDEQTDITRNGLIWEGRFKCTEQQRGFDGGIILTLVDVTETRQSLQMRQDFFSNASHELKTPITAIKGNAELLLSGLPLSEAQKKELLNRIGSETDRMSILIQDIIMLSRIESGGVPQEVETIDFGLVIAESIEEVQTMAQQNQVTISAALQPILFTAGRKDMEQLTGNLLTNAVKYNQPGGKVDVTLKKENNGLSFSVRNDGEPIPMESQMRVFERFYRVDKGRSRAVGGTGLGLSIVKHIVDSMHGTIRLTSSRSFGTCITVWLPLKEDT